MQESVTLKNTKGWDVLPRQVLGAVILHCDPYMVSRMERVCRNWRNDIRQQGDDLWKRMSWFSMPVSLPNVRERAIARARRIPPYFVGVVQPTVLAERSILEHPPYAELGGQALRFNNTIFKVSKNGHTFTSSITETGIPLYPNRTYGSCEAYNDNGDIKHILRLKPGSFKICRKRADVSIPYTEQTHRIDWSSTTVTGCASCLDNTSLSVTGDEVIATVNNRILQIDPATLEAAPCIFQFPADHGQTGLARIRNGVLFAVHNHGLACVDLTCQPFKVFRPSGHEPTGKRLGQCTEYPNKFINFTFCGDNQDALVFHRITTGRRNFHELCAISLTGQPIKVEEEKAEVVDPLDGLAKALALD